MAAGHSSFDGCATPDAACRIPATVAPPPALAPDSWRVRRGRAVRRAARARERHASARIDALVLDVGGVVIPSLFESVALPGFPSGPLGPEDAWRSVQRGETTERDYWAAVSRERPGIDVAELWRRCSRVRDELRGALDALVRRVRVVAFTNDMAHFFGEDWPRRFPELASFDTIVEAGRLGVHKPDPEAFHAAAGAIGELPERCLFVDDLEANVVGARRAGMQGLVFDVRDPGASIAAVVRALDIPDEPRHPRTFRGAPR